MTQTRDLPASVMEAANYATYILNRFLHSHSSCDTYWINLFSCYAKLRPFRGENLQIDYTLTKVWERLQHTPAYLLPWQVERLWTQRQIESDNEPIKNAHELLHAFDNAFVESWQKTGIATLFGLISCLRNAALSKQHPNAARLGRELINKVKLLEKSAFVYTYDPPLDPEAEFWTETGGWIDIQQYFFWFDTPFPQIPRNMLAPAPANARSTYDCIPGNSQNNGNHDVIMGKSLLTLTQPATMAAPHAPPSMAPNPATAVPVNQVILYRPRLRRPNRIRDGVVTIGALLSAILLFMPHPVANQAPRKQATPIMAMDARPGGGNTGPTEPGNSQKIRTPSVDMGGGEEPVKFDRPPDLSRSVDLASPPDLARPDLSYPQKQEVKPLPKKAVVTPKPKVVPKERPAALTKDDLLLPTQEWTLAPWPEGGGKATKYCDSNFVNCWYCPPGVGLKIISLPDNSRTMSITISGTKRPATRCNKDPGKVKKYSSPPPRLHTR